MSNPDLDMFGPFIVDTDVGDAVVGTLQKWLPDYVGLVIRRINQTPGWLPVPQSFVITDDPDHWPEDQPPAVVVAIPGTLDTPKSNGQRDYRACWDVRVLTYVDANDRVSTERLGKYYATVMRLLLTKQGALGGFAVDTAWLGSEYDRRTSNRVERTLGVSQVRFRVEVAQVSRALGGPLAPSATPQQPPTDWPVVTNPTVKFIP